MIHRSGGRLLPWSMRPLFCSALLAAGLVLPTNVRADRAEKAAEGEEFHYRWELRNVLGVVAGLFFPRHGDGELTFKTDPAGRLRSELVITSPDSREGEFWRYGAEIDTRTMQPLRAWSSYYWRGQAKSKTKEIEQKGVVDIVSGLYAIRRDPPAKKEHLEIWSDGKIYPIVLLPLGLERRMVSGKPVATRHFGIRPDEEAPLTADNAHRWKGKIDFWFATDTVSTPVEIDISRSLADVRLELLAAAPATTG